MTTDSRRADQPGASVMTTDSKRADQLLDLALRHARTIRAVIGELAKLNGERELRIIRRQLADLTRRTEPAPPHHGKCTMTGPSRLLYRIGQTLLQLAVLALEPSQALGLRDFEPAVFGFPVVEARSLIPCFRQSRRFADSQSR
jgi:hypothetical protein